MNTETTAAVETAPVVETAAVVAVATPAKKATKPAAKKAVVAKKATKPAAKKAVVAKKAAPAAKAIVVKQAVAKTGARPPAAELMLARKRVTFGASFINGVLAGVHRDVAKIVLLGKELGVGTKSELSKLSADTLRERVGAAIMAAEKLPTSAAY